MTGEDRSVPLPVNVDRLRAHLIHAHSFCGQCQGFAATLDADALAATRASTGACSLCGNSFHTVEQHDASTGAGLDEPTAGEVADWLDSSEGRIEDILGLWVQGKRSSRWAAEQLIDEGHLARLAAAPSTPDGGLRLCPKTQTTESAGSQRCGLFEGHPMPPWHQFYRLAEFAAAHPQDPPEPEKA